MGRRSDSRDPTRSWYLSGGKMKRFCIIAFLLIGACALHDPMREVHFWYADRSTSPFKWSFDAQMTALGSANPVSDAQAEFDRGHRGFVGIMGIDRVFPGLNADAVFGLSEEPWRSRVKVISGTSDYSTDIRHVDLMVSATKYASAYNQRLIALLKEHGEKAPIKAPEPTTMTTTPRANSP